MKEALFPPGHFYSPVPDPEELASRRKALWPEHPEVPHIDFNDDHHRKVLEDWLPKFMPDFDYPERKVLDAEARGFHIDNSQFSHLDCRVLFTLLRAWKPGRMIEVGGGYSTLLSADVNHRFLNASMAFTCVEPYPREFLKRGLAGLGELLVERVEKVPLERFADLGAGDVLFIDSSHVCKTGSDVNYLYFEVIPRLATGVRIHVHDVFLPAEYPENWVLEENRSWNEQYLVRAMLTHNPHYRVLFGSNYAALRFPEKISRALGGQDGDCMGGGSLWFEVA
jgi:predicted O-methyltransferase YrrM